MNVYSAASLTCLLPSVLEAEAEIVAEAIELKVRQLSLCPWLKHSPLSIEASDCGNCVVGESGEGEASISPVIIETNFWRTAMRFYWMGESRSRGMFLLKKGLKNEESKIMSSHKCETPAFFLVCTSSYEYEFFCYPPHDASLLYRPFHCDPVIVIPHHVAPLRSYYQITIS